jgi:hypothetical protein
MKHGKGTGTKVKSNGAPTPTIDFGARLAAMEDFLRRHLPFVPFHNQQGRDNKQRVVLAWDGLRAVARKSVAGLPPPTPTELEQALVGFSEDLRSVLLQAGVTEKPPF